MHTSTKHLRSLTLPFFSLWLSEFIPALQMCPTLEDLIILHPSDEHRDGTEVAVDDLSPSLIPLLSTFEGPYTHLLNFGRNRPLKCVKLWGMDDSAYTCDSIRLLEVLYQYSQMNTTLESLHVSICRVTFELLAMLTSFPNIRAVTMEAADNPPLTPLPDTSEVGLRILTAKTPITVSLQFDISHSNLTYLITDSVHTPP
jgi:hypothetical protein